MRYGEMVERLARGETIQMRCHGNSMTPAIKSGQLLTIAPITAPPKKGDAVLARVNGHYFVHKVTGVRHGSYQISNNHGHVNGWTASVYGIVTAVGD